MRLHSTIIWFLLCTAKAAAEQRRWFYSSTDYRGDNKTAPASWAESSAREVETITNRVASKSDVGSYGTRQSESAAYQSPYDSSAVQSSGTMIEGSMINMLTSRLRAECTSSGQRALSDSTNQSITFNEDIPFTVHPDEPHSTIVRSLSNTTASRTHSASNGKTSDASRSGSVSDVQRVRTAGIDTSGVFASSVTSVGQIQRVSMASGARNTETIGHSHSFNRSSRARHSYANATFRSTGRIWHPSSTYRFQNLTTASVTAPLLTTAPPTTEDCQAALVAWSSRSNSAQYDDFTCLSTFNTSWVFSTEIQLGYADVYTTIEGFAHARGSFTVTSVSTHFHTAYGESEACTSVPRAANATIPAPPCTIGAQSCAKLYSMYDSYQPWIINSTYVPAKATLGPDVDQDLLWPRCDRLIDTSDCTTVSNTEGCSVSGKNVQMYYWHSSSSVSARTVQIGGITMTSPSVYLSFDALGARQFTSTMLSCGSIITSESWFWNPLGDQHTGLWISLDPASMSTLEKTAILRGQRLFPTPTAFPGFQHLYWENDDDWYVTPHSLDFEHLTQPDPRAYYRGCPQKDFSLRDARPDYYQIIGQAPTGCLDDQSYCNTIFDDLYKPQISIPTEVLNFDPLWRTCGPELYGVYDPPIALNEVADAQEALLLTADLRLTQTLSALPAPVWSTAFASVTTSFPVPEAPAPQQERQTSDVPLPNAPVQIASIGIDQTVSLLLIDMSSQEPTTLSTPIALSEVEILKGSRTGLMWQVAADTAVGPQPGRPTETLETFYTSSMATRLGWQTEESSVPSPAAVQGVSSTDLMSELSSLALTLMPQESPVRAKAEFRLTAQGAIAGELDQHTTAKDAVDVLLEALPSSLSTKFAMLMHGSVDSLRFQAGPSAGEAASMKDLQKSLVLAIDRGETGEARKVPAQMAAPMIQLASIGSTAVFAVGDDLRTFAIAGQTLTRGQNTVLDGSKIEVGSSDITIGSKTLSLPAVQALATVAGHILRLVDTDRPHLFVDNVEQPMSARITLDGTVVSMDENKIVIGSSTIPLNVKAIATIGSHQVFMHHLDAGIVADGTTYTKGQSLTLDDTIVYVGTKGVVIGSSTFALADTVTTTIAGHQVIADGNPVDGVIVDGQTYMSGRVLTLDGTIISVLPAALVVGSMTVPLPTPGSMPQKSRGPQETRSTMTMPSGIESKATCRMVSLFKSSSLAMLCIAISLF